jgi:S1-C subfamily serine protease
MMLEFGQGVRRDYVQAYMWNNLAAAGGNDAAVQGRDRLEHLMTAAQIAEAQRRTAEWRPVHHGEQQAAPGKSDDEWADFNPRPVPDTAKPAPEAASGRLGTAFFVGEGVLLTNAHVVKGCSEARIGPPEQRVKALVFARDEENDLVLLRATIHPPATAALRLSVRQGEAIVAYGYPLPGLLASGGNLTTGNITALSGIGDDTRFLQISAPVQPGNSGGPLLDGSGNVIGIVEGKLDATKVASAIGDLPQNVNFALKASVVATFLDSNGILYTSGVSAAGRSPSDIAEDAKRFTVPVECSGSAE